MIPTDAKIKILYLSHSAYLNGGEICLFNLVKSLNRDLFEPVIVFPETGPLLEKLRSTGIKTYITPLERWIGLEGKRNYSSATLQERLTLLLRIIEQEDPDVIHTNTSVVFEGAIAAKLKNLPHVWHIHEVLKGHPTLDPMFPLPSLYWAIEKLSDRVVAVSNDMRKELSEYIAEEKLETVFNGISIETPDETDAISVRQELAIPGEYAVAINVATILKYKGQDDLLDAAALVKARGFKVKYLLAGSGSKENVARMLEKASALGLAQDIYYLGHRQDIPRLIKGSDFFVLPSLKEGFPLVVLEAMALGKPIVATDCCGPADMIDDGVSGFLVPIRRPDLLAEKIMLMVRDKAGMAEMGARAYRTFQDKFTLAQYARGFESIYSRLAGTHASSAVLTDYDLSLLGSAVAIYQNHIDTVKSNIQQLSQIAEQNQRLAARDRQITERNQQLADRDRQITERNQQLADRDRQLAERNQQLADRDRQIDQLNKAVSERDASIHELTNSISWKMTAPLRWLFDSIAKRNRK